MESIWSKTVKLQPRKPLERDMTTGAAVIGGGLAGILTAWFLQQRGIETVVLEASRIGSGQTQNTTAKVTAQHGLKYAKLVADLGQGPARQYAQWNQRAIETYRRIIQAQQIECQWRDCPAYLYSRQRAEPLREEAAAARQLGLDATFTTDTALPFPVKGAVRLPGQGMFHPLAFLRPLADELTIFENTRATSAAGNQVCTDRGTVTAKHLIFATHYPFLNIPGYYFMRMHQERSYVLALERAVPLDGVYLGVEPGELSLRNSGEHLLAGGGNHRTGENTAGGRYEALRAETKIHWPKSRVLAHWSAQDCMPMDGVPYIGRYSASTPNWYVATGFGKWGMTSSMVSAMVISGLIAGEEAPAVFSPQRFALSASAKNLMEDGKQAVKGLVRELFVPPEAEAELLPLGHGGVVNWGGKKVGVYKDDKGTLFMVSTHCPHMGCQVEWNPDEKTWDCPCHGSRFDFRGNLMDNPAQEGLDLG